MFQQLLVAKPNPGLFSKNKGGNSALFKTESQFTQVSVANVYSSG